MIYVVPVVILITIVVATIKKIPVYDSFIYGAKESFSLVISILPYLASVFMLLEIFRVSGLSEKITAVLAIPFLYIGIPKELCELLILRPLSGSGSLAVVESIFAEYGVDSYVARCAGVIMASNDTVMYISAVYLSKSADKSCLPAIIISIVSSFVGAMFTCFICRFL